MDREQDKSLRTHLAQLLAGEGAHIGFDDVVGRIPKNMRGAKPPGMPHTPWRLLEHMRLAQHDILDFCVNREYKELSWPGDYWPQDDAPPSERAWDESLRQFRHDLKQMQALVTDTNTDLFAKIPWGDGQDYLREALVLADHNSYHLGEIVAVLRALGAWKDK